MENYNHINQLLEEVKIIVEKYAALSKSTAGKFNVFSLLRNESDEVKLHSRFIAELLNPRGSHEQGTIFLDLFLKVFEIENIDSSSSRVDVEHFTGLISKDKTRGGNIDILVDDGENCIKIENKIYAEEQENQLLRYHNYKKGHLVFLTLFGNKSDMHKDLEMLEIEYSRKSYKEDIVNWLEQCVISMQHTANIRESLTQYLNLVKQLTHQNTNRKMSNKIVSKVLGDKESFDAYLALRKTEDGDEIFEKIALDILIPFFKEFALKNNLTAYNLEKSLVTKRKQFSGFHFSNQMLESVGLKISVQFLRDSNKMMYYGLSYLSPDPKRTEFFEKLYEKSNKVMYKPKGSNKWWLNHSFWDEYNDWGNIYTIHRMIYGDFKDLFSKKMGNILNMVENTILEEKNEN